MKMTDREKLIELIDKARKAMKKETISCYLESNSFIAEYLIANGVTVQKHGRWIAKEDGVTHCSRCDRVGNSHIDRYCPNCGAKMDLEE